MNEPTQRKLARAARPYVNLLPVQYHAACRYLVRFGLYDGDARVGRMKIAAALRAIRAMDRKWAVECRQFMFNLAGGFPVRPTAWDMQLAATQAHLDTPYATRFPCRVTAGRRQPVLKCHLAETATHYNPNLKGQQ